MAKTRRKNNKSNKISRFFKKFKNPKTLAFLLFIILFASIGTYMYVNSRAAGTASMSVVPANQTLSSGSTLTLTIQENSNNDAVNAIQADLTYDQTKLKCNSIDTSIGAFAIKVKAECSNGVINIASGSSTAVSGVQTIAVISMSTIANGTATVNFSNTSAIVRANDTSNVLGILNGASYTIGSIAYETVPTVPTGLTLVSSTKTSITFKWLPSTDNVAVKGYKIYRDGAQVGTSTTNQYTDSGLTFKKIYSYTVLAYDDSGNNSAQSAASSFKAVVKKQPR
jgi:hypothetical protein